MAESMRTLDLLREICVLIRFDDWQLRCGDDGPALWIQWQFPALCSDTGEPGLIPGRKWRVSHYATPDEVVKTAFKAVLTALEHEAREIFLYREEAIFHPHTDVEALVELAKQKQLVKRSEE